MKEEKNKVQGEGDYQSDRRYTESAQSFVKSGKVSDAARNAAPRDSREGEDLKRAESIGESHSKGEDPSSRHSPHRAK